MTSGNKNLQHFTSSFNPENLTNEVICFKQLPSCMEFQLHSGIHVITNRESYFKNIFVTVTAVSDFHKLMMSSTKRYSSKNVL